MIGKADDFDDMIKTITISWPTHSTLRLLTVVAINAWRRPEFFAETPR